MSEVLYPSGYAGSQAPAWEPRSRSSSFARREARASNPEFPSWSLGTSEKDQDSVDAASLPEPDGLAAEAMSELTEALRELNGLMQALGAGDQAQAQNDLLAEVLGLAGHE